MAPLDPHATIAWPHRLLHDAADEIERLSALESRPVALADAIPKDTAKDSELAEARARGDEYERLYRQAHLDYVTAEYKLAAAEQALEPFARISDLIDSETEGFSDADNLNMFVDESDYLLDRIKVGDFRRARTVLSREKEASDDAA